jgi:PAS domain S-box-containing protein
MKDALIMTDRDGKVRVINAAAEAITGWTADAAVGRPLGEIFRIDSEAKGRATTENRLRTRNRGSVPIEGRAEAVCDAEGGLQGIQVHFSTRRNVVTWPKHLGAPGPHPDAA